MSNRWVSGSSKWLPLSILFGIVATSILLFAWLTREPRAPSLLVIAGCGSERPGKIRIGFKRSDDYFGIQLDVPDGEFIVHTSTQDMPPGKLYAVTRRDNSGTVEVSDTEPLSFSDKSTAPFSTFSEFNVIRDVRDSRGRVVGKDHWGYLKTGESWRYVIFAWGDRLGYRPLAPTAAKKLDELINSACVLPSPTS